MSVASLCDQIGGYHKIDSVFKRDMEDPRKPLVMDKWANPEFQYLADSEWEFTEKVDGTNIRVAFDGDRVEIGGRTARAQIPAMLLNYLTDVFTVEQLRSAFPAASASAVHSLFGEGYGKGIQAVGAQYGDRQEFILFDVRIGRWWLRRPDVESVAWKLLIPVVPVIGRGTLWDAISMASAGIMSRVGSGAAEGIVARPAVELCNRGGERIIAKIKCRDFFPGNFVDA